MMIFFGDDITVEASSYVIAGAAHGKDVMDGGDGDDQLVGGGAGDTLIGGAGNDTLYGDGDGLAAQYHGDDMLEGGAGDDSLYGDGGNDTLSGGDGNDLLSGDAGNDELLGGAGNDSLAGGDGDDSLDGGSGNNTLQGGAGNDTYVVHAGDAIVDSEGQNTILVDGLSTDVRVSTNYSNGLTLNWGGASGSTSNADGVFVEGEYSAAKTRVRFSDGSESTLGQLGLDTLNTSISIGSNESGATVYGGTQADSLYATGSGSVVTGGKGNDSIYLGARGQSVRYRQGDGVDVLSGNPSSGAIVALEGDFHAEALRLEMDAQRQISVRFGEGEEDRMSLDVYLTELKQSKLIDRFTFSDGSALTFADLLARGVTVLGTAQDEYLFGTNANDQIFGGAGNNILYGMAGDETYVIGSGSSNRIDDNEGLSVIRLTGSSSWDDVVLSRPDGQSNDLLLTMSDNTTVTLTSALLRAGKFSLELANGETRTLSSLVASLPYLVVSGGYEADVIRGSEEGNGIDGGDGNDTLTGGAGTDFLSGSAGADVIDGGAGDDVLVGGADDDVFQINPGGGVDQILDYEGSNTVRFGVGIDPTQLSVERLEGSTDVRISIDGSNSVLVLRALEGAVAHYEFADGTNWSYADLINRFSSPNGQILAGDDLDNAVDGSSGDDILFGNRGNDVLHGHAGNDELIGGDDSDQLIGGAGDDTLDGGQGLDTYDFAVGDGEDFLIDTQDASVISFGQAINLQSLCATHIALNGDDYISLAYSATDAVLIKQGVLLSGTAFRFADGTQLTQAQVYASALMETQVLPSYTDGNDEIAGYAGDDVLAGGDGEDHLSGGKGNDTLNGGAGSDVLEGGDGTDTYVMDSGGGLDSLVEALGQNSVIALTQGDEANLSYARTNNGLLISDVSLGSSFFIANFYAGSGNWTLKTAEGVELNLRDLAISGFGDKTTAQRREDFYAKLIAGAEPVNVRDGQVFSATGSRTFTDYVGNQSVYTFSRDRVLLQSDNAEMSGMAYSLTFGGESSYIGSVTGTRSYEVTEVTYTTVTQTTPGRNIVLPSPGAGGSIGYPVVNGLFVEFNSVTHQYYMWEPDRTTTTRTPHYVTHTVTETYVQDLYRTEYTASSVVEDIRGGDSANSIYLGGSASKLVSGGDGDDVIYQAGSDSNEVSFDGLPGSQSVWADGGGGNDSLHLGKGDDELSGGAGTDYLDGGAGNDTYVVSADDDGWDTIYDSAAAAVSVAFKSNFYGHLDAQLAGELYRLINGPDSSPASFDGLSDMYGDVLATADNLNALMSIYQRRPELDPVPWTAYLSLQTRSAMQSVGWDQLIANVQGVPYQSYYFRNDPITFDSYKPELLRPNITFTDEALLSSVTGKDTVRFGAGISLSGLQIGWGLVELEEGTRDVMLLSWGGAGGVKVVMPDAKMPGVGVELFEFSDGTRMTMTQMLGLAPPRPVTANSLVAGTALDLVEAVEGSAFSFVMPVDTFIATGNRTPRFSLVAVNPGDSPPGWLEIDPYTGALSGTPENADVGDFAVKIVARQTTGELASQVFNLHVGNINTAPVPAYGAVIGQQTAETGEVFNWALPAGMFVDQDADDRLSLRVESADGTALPAWLKLNPVTRTLEGRPESSDLGELALRLVAMDLSGELAYLSFSINIVAPVNHAPTLAAGPNDQNAAAGSLWTFALPENSFADEDANDMLAYGATLENGEALPSWLSFEGANLTFSGVPPSGTSVVMKLLVVATDRAGATVAASFSLKISRGTDGTPGNDSLTGTASADSLHGLAGNDTLDGSAGADSLYGGVGNDDYIVSSKDDVVVELAGEGTDTVRSYISYTLTDNVEKLSLKGHHAINGAGNSLANVLTGNSSNNRLTGADGDDTLNGAAGADTMVGGFGNDQYIVDNPGDMVVEQFGEGTDTVNASINYVLSGQLEKLVLTGTGNWSASGNTLNNVLKGNAGNNVLDGREGADTMLGAGGDDSYYVDNLGDLTTEAAQAGTDEVIASISWKLSRNIENLTLVGSGNINAAGNGLANVITGNSGNNTLDGKTGADTMLGGRGDDTYWTDDAGDVLTEYANEGLDTVRASINYTLSSNLDNLILTGSQTINGVGNELDNMLTGNANKNTLRGAAGDDTLDGGGGNDKLVGGDGNDTYRLGKAYGADTIKENDASHGNHDILQFMDGIATDQIWLSRASNSLEVSIIGTADKMTVNNWYLGNQYHVEEFRTSDGKTLLDSQVQNLVQAMAGFSPPAAGETSLPPAYRDALTSVIAANWQ